MTQSFVRQGANIVCSYMTISSPRIICLDPIKESVETQGITIYSKIPEPLLNILDKKLDACFKCKMPKKVWGGLAAFFAGIAIAAIVIAVLIAASVSLPVIIAAGALSLKTVLITAAVATVAAAATAVTTYTIYSVDHACDVSLEGDWIGYHKTVLIEDQQALLNKSQLKCPNGGILNIIIDDELALLAARVISTVNDAEVWSHWLSKFFNGTITFLFSGPIGVLISSGFEFYNTMALPDDLSLEENATITAVESATSTTLETAILHSAMNEGGSRILDVTIAGIEKGVITEKGGDRILNFLARNGKSFSWKNFGSNLMTGLTTALIGFAIDQLSNVAERYYERQAGKALQRINDKDEEKGNNIGIIAVTQ